MPDVNVLVYAHRKDTEQHQSALEWLDQLALVDGPFALSALTATGFVRVVTGKTVFATSSASLLKVCVGPILGFETRPVRRIHDLPRHDDLRVKDRKPLKREAA